MTFKKTALITGATKGLGRGAAIAIAQAGGNIIAVGRNQLELNSLDKEIKKLKVKYSSINCDVNDYNNQRNRNTRNEERREKNVENYENGASGENYFK